MSKTITIKGAYGESNFGDDLLMKVFESYFKEEFNVSPNFQGVDVAYPKKMLDGSSYNKVMSGKVDLLVYGGGTQFFAFSTKNSTTLQNKILRAFKNPKIGRASCRE